MSQSGFKIKPSLENMPLPNSSLPMARNSLKQTLVRIVRKIAIYFMKIIQNYKIIRIILTEIYIDNMNEINSI